MQNSFLNTTNQNRFIWHSIYNLCLTLFELGFSLPPIWIGGGGVIYTPLRKIGFLNEYLLNHIEILREAVNIILILIFCWIGDFRRHFEAKLT